MGFNVGDKVRLTTDAWDGSEHFREGAVGTITGLPGIREDGDEYTYFRFVADSEPGDYMPVAESEIEHVTPSPLFKVGDRLVAKDNAPNKSHRGVMGTVTRVSDFRPSEYMDETFAYYYVLNWDNPDETNDAIWEKYVELAPVEVAFAKDEPLRFANGAIVRFVRTGCPYGIGYEDCNTVKIEDTGDEICADDEELERVITVGSKIAYLDEPYSDGSYIWTGSVVTKIAPKIDPKTPFAPVDATSPSGLEGAFYYKDILPYVEPEAEVVEFAIGDKVVVGEDAFYRDQFGYEEKNYLSSDYEGLVGTIYDGPDSDGDFGVEFDARGSQHISPECLTLFVPEETEPTFVPGDRVRVTVSNPHFANGGTFSGLYDYLGREGTVLQEQTGIRLGETADVPVDWADGGWDFMHHECLELVVEPAFKPGDRVRFVGADSDEGTVLSGTDEGYLVKWDCGIDLAFPKARLELIEDVQVAQGFPKDGLKLADSDEGRELDVFVSVFDSKGIYVEMNGEWIGSDNHLWLTAEQTSELTDALVALRGN